MSREIETKKNRRPATAQILGHHAVRTRFTRPGPVLVLLILGWPLLLGGVVHAVFLAFFNYSLLTPAANFLTSTPLFRVLFLALVAYALYDLSRAVGEAGVLQPMERFRRHLEETDERGGRPFHPRAHDRHFLALADAYNALLERLEAAYAKQTDRTQRLLRLIAAHEINLPAEDRLWVEEIRNLTESETASNES